MDRDERMRRKKAKMRQLFIRRIIVCALLLIIAGLVVTLVTLFIRSLISHFKEDITDPAPGSDITKMTDPVPDDDTDTSDEKAPEDEDLSDPSYLGENIRYEDGCITVRDDIKLIEGYDTKVSENVTTFYEEGIYSTYGVLIDLDSNTVVAGRSYDSVIYPASMTKIMTVLVAAEHLSEEDLDKKVTITTEETDFVFSKKLSAVNFAAGEEVTVKDLFYGTILPSGADAALALAKYVSGSEEDFVSLMNEKVSELGLSDTHFTNCTGIYDDDNRSTCTDIAMILKAAVENDFCNEVLNAHIYTTSRTTEHPDGIEISNWFLRRIEDKDTKGEVLCAKTGFVNESGCCAASFLFSSSGHPYICVTADAWSSWRAIYDHVYAYCEYTAK